MTTLRQHNFDTSYSAVDDVSVCSHLGHSRVRARFCVFCKMEQKLYDFIKSIDKRLSALELKVVDVNSNHIARDLSAQSEHSAPVQSEPSVLHDDHVVPSLASAGATGGSQDIQGDFQALKDSLSRIKLPSDLKLNESRQGIQRQDQPVFNVLCKCSRYNETLVKLLSTIEPWSSATQETLDQLFF